MWLVLCSSADTAALWAYQGLKQLGLGPLELVTAEHLASASRWEHRLRGLKTEVSITLADGRVIDGSQVRGVLNRMHAPSELTTQRAVASDKSYAQSETQAFYLSWLHGLPGVVINRPTPYGLSGAWLHPSEWTMRACLVGLRTLVYRQSARDLPNQNYPTFAPQSPNAKSIIALQGKVFGHEVPDAVAQACGRLAADAGAAMLGVDLNLDHHGQWRFASATPSPELRHGGMPLLHHMAQILNQGARS